jgi:hypothetical protein
VPSQLFKTKPKDRFGIDEMENDYRAKSSINKDLVVSNARPDLLAFRLMHQRLGARLRSREGIMLVHFNSY